MLFDSLLIILLIICVFTDITKRKIYNKVLFPALVLTFVIHFVIGGFQGLGISILGLIIGLGILIIPYFSGGIGAGDVKLLALIGAMKGSAFVVYSALYMAIVGGIIAVLILLYKRRLTYTLNTILLKTITFKYSDKEEFNSIITGSSFPYAIAIAGGVFVKMLFERGLVIC